MSIARSARRYGVTQHEAGWLGDIAAVAFFEVINIPPDNIPPRHFIKIRVHHVVHPPMHGQGYQQALKNTHLED